MKLKLPSLPEPRARRPRRANRRERQAVTPAPAAGILRVPRRIALAAIAVLIGAASGVGFAESYRALFLWAQHHGALGLWAGIWPLMVDVFIAVGELALFIALVDRWTIRQRLGAWAVLAAGLGVSVAGNIGHVAGRSLTDRETAAVPPLAAAVALWVGLGVLKRVVQRHHEQRADPVTGPAADTSAADQNASAEAIAEAVAAVLDKRFADLLGALRVIAERVPDATWDAVPGDAESAALAALRATAEAGNPLSGRQLEKRFGLSRAQAAKVRQQVPALANGHAPGDADDDPDE
jgi:hypothetical protein